ncbi:hypothetical protein IAT38_006229 [Cryptococcus sp. DSM 104549]
MELGDGTSKALQNSPANTVKKALCQWYQGYPEIGLPPAKDWTGEQIGSEGVDGSSTYRKREKVAERFERYLDAHPELASQTHDQQYETFQLDFAKGEGVNKVIALIDAEDAAASLRSSEDVENASPVVLSDSE